MDIWEEAEFVGLTKEEVEDAYERFGAQHEAALALVEEKGVENLTFEELIAASSLGTPIALYLQSKCPPEVHERLLELLHRP